MFTVEKAIKLILLLLVLTSGLLLGLSLKQYNLVTIAIFAAISGHIITDRLRWFRLDGTLANIASMIILVIAMRDFLPEDSTGKLVAVAHLLIYLQSLLMFQEKTPRLVWQILTLSLLQIVIAAIFSMNLESSVLFISYFLLAGITLALQLFYKNNREMVRINQNSARKGLRYLQQKNEADETLIFFDPDRRSVGGLKPLMNHLLIWFVISLAFTLVMFNLLPRDTQPWLTGNRIDVAAVSPNKSVDLMNRDQIQQSFQMVFRVNFEDLRTGQPLTTYDPPYFRGIALSHLVVEDGYTNWRAPHDRVSPMHYRDLNFHSPLFRPVRQRIKAEENRHPLIYSMMPATLMETSPDSIEYCFEISALTRCRINSKLELAPYSYDLVSYLNDDGLWLDSWPYISNGSAFRNLPMAEDPAEEAWLTLHHPERYPTIVGLGEQIAREVRSLNPKASRQDLCKAMEAYFLEPDRFQYTLDFREVPRNEALDPNEDFVRNYRSGHCEMFASALTLMLRSQNIPARLVTGFHGGDKSTLSDELIVRGSHAHAWVEAYLAPEDCTDEMLTNGGAGDEGAWLRLDPTPPSANVNSPGVGTDAIELARTLWQDYVLGMNVDTMRSHSGELNDHLYSLFQMLPIEGWDSAMIQLDESVKSRTFQLIMGTLVVAPPLLMWLFIVYSNFRATKRSGPSKKSLRRWIANALSYLSPSLAQWVLSGSDTSHTHTRFYSRMLKILLTHGLERAPHQSHRDFAKQVGQTYAHHPMTDMISSVVYEVSEIFNEVRFGRKPIPEDLRTQIELCLDELERELPLENSAN